MSSWNEIHYARAQEFVRLIADTLAPPAASPAPAAAPGKALAGALFRSASPAGGSPAYAPAPPKATAGLPAPTAPGPTAASVFNKIPWKK
jgi:hypothetical protein